jgi:tRNA-dihydrouridine synthase A
MQDPDKVRRIVQQMMRRVCHTNVSVKCRVGVVKNSDELIKLTDEEIYRNLCQFIHQVRDGGVNKVIIHARVGLLRGLSTAQNRTIPILKYDIVQRIKYEFPDMNIILNGGIDNFEDSLNYIGRSNQIKDCQEEEKIDRNDIYDWNKNPMEGVMIGREAYGNIWLFKDADTIFYKEKFNPLQNKSRLEILQNYLEYAENAQEIGMNQSRVPNLTKPLHNFFVGCDSNKLYKRKLDELLKKHVKR